MLVSFTQLPINALVSVIMRYSQLFQRLHDRIGHTDYILTKCGLMTTYKIFLFSVSLQTQNQYVKNSKNIMDLKNTGLWHMTPYSLDQIYCFRRICSLHLMGALLGSKYKHQVSPKWYFSTRLYCILS